MAATWKGTISFGLVSIPVELHGAVSNARPHFRLLHRNDKSPVNYERICRREEKPVAWKEIVKGYEYSKGKFVVLTKEDFETAAVEKTKAIDILDFVRSAQVDDRFFDTPYYVLPGKGGERSYTLLREAIRDSGRLGIGKIVLRETQHLAALSVVEEALVLTLMRFADELVDVARFDFPKASKVRPKELEMARMLVESLAADWEPDKYKDDYRENLMRVIKAKIKGGTPALIVEEEKRDGAVVDLMERLRQSLEGRGVTAARAAGKASASARRRKRGTAAA